MRAPVDAAEWERVFQLRWHVLREPWGQPPGSERDPLDPVAVHRAAFTDAGEVVGVGRLHLNSPSEGQVRYMAVDPGWRQRGVGTLILLELEAEAIRLGVTRLILEARAEAIPFYLRHSYRIIAPGKTLFGSVQHSIMTKSLPQMPRP